MNDRPPSAAARIYPHLKSQERPVQQRTNNSVADAMYPSLAPKPPTDPYYESFLRHMRAMGFISMERQR